jgi:phosphatidylserine/phosphatidylglycerophosphate/cardiolipin synthase-like enzyme
MLRMIFTDPTGNYDMPGDSLANELIHLIGRAKISIDIHGYELTEFFNKDWVLYNALKEKLEHGAILSIYGNDKNQIENINEVMFHNHKGQVKYFFYKKPDKLDSEAKKKSLYHPKAIVVDQRLMYIGSANISQNAMKNSVEIGAIIEDAGQCKELKKFVNYLIAEKMLIPLSNFG